MTATTVEELTTEAFDALVALKLNDLQLGPFTDDVARKIFKYEDIAARHHLDIPMFVHILSIPPIARLVKTKRALWESDGNVTERLKQLTAVGMVECTPAMFAILMAKDTPTNQKIELWKEMGKQSGASNPPPRELIQGGGGNALTPFVVNINLGAITKTFTTVEGVPMQIDAPPPRPVLLDDDDAPPDDGDDD